MTTGEPLAFELYGDSRTWAEEIDEIAQRPLKKSVVVYGPQGIGKTTNAAAMCKFFGLSFWTEEHHAGRELPPLATLGFTNKKDYPGALDFFEVMYYMRVRVPNHQWGEGRQLFAIDEPVGDAD